MAAFEPNRCYACKKLFCCMDCCTNHIRNKHPGRESECPLCRSEFLIVRNFNNSHLTCHVVINHLPLQCRCCGDLFESSTDLKGLGTCSRRLLIKKSNVVLNEGHSVVSHAPSPLTQTPLNPLNARERYSFEGDYNSNFDSLTSPPEFTRHTSTPMQIGLSRQSTNIIFKTPRSPNFSLKTPKTPTCIPQMNDRGEGLNEVGIKSCYSKTETPHIHKKHSSIDSNHQELLEQSESIYLSFSPSTRLNSSDKLSLKSILLSKSPMEHPVELEATSADMDLTEPASSSPALLAQCSQIVKSPVDGVIRFPPEVKDSAKRVRFSDQFDVKQECKSISPNKSCMTDTEEFFEARQSLSEFTVINSANFNNTSPIGVTNIKEEEELNQLISTKFSPPQAPNNLDLTKYEEITENEGNKENIMKINIEKGIPAEEKMNQGNTCVTSRVSETSRVVMMVLVEKTGDSDNVDLQPLIDSGLRTLESVTTSMNAEKQTPSASGESSDVTKRLAVVSVDSYKSVSSIKCFNKPISETGNILSDQRRCEKPEASGSQGGGLLSAVANAVRTAFKNISEAVSTRPVVLESMRSNQVPRTIPTIKIETPSFIQLSSPPSRPLKRSRDDLISFDATETDCDDSSNDIRSPEQKRQRAWYRQIRGREPIARMKSDSMHSSRAISNETQCLQQGSLSVGDTILPLPSRAHQATQTDQ